VPARGRDLRLRLMAGLPLLEAVRQAFAAEGFASGVAELGPLALAPFAYVMPALCEDGSHAAFYSATFRPPGVSRLESGALTFGSRDGAPFFHCHALWRQADGRRTGGHILPDETVLAESAEVAAYGLAGATFAANQDVETNFKLFGPVASGAAGPSPDAFAIRLRPNQDFAGALETFCREHGIGRARIRGGVGSTIGALFEDGTEIANFATELYLRGGTVGPDGAGGRVATLDAALVDYTGALAEGRLARGSNPVLMTMELVVEPF